ncbi:MAG: amidohydrolase family protein [Planctomycetaceae bacterium]|jgi:imidazolonepropionase-like amidohydrolase|nr:amidohydrolase family protein [Planctomycetaceae bacterium]
MSRIPLHLLLLGFALPAGIAAAEPAAPLAIRGDIVHTMAGPAIRDGVVLLENGKVKQVGPAAEVVIPPGMRVLRGAVVTPGLIDAHTAVGLAGFLNQPQDQDQLDTGEPVQPELRALDSYNPRERLVEWIRGFGITTIHTGHAPGALVSGQTMVVKTVGATVEEATLKPVAMVAVTLGDEARPSDDKKSPGTRSKAVAMLRGELVKAREYARKRGLADAEKRPDRDLRREVFADVLAGKLPLLVTVNRATDIDAALRVAAEFGIRIVLDSAAEAYLATDRIKAAGVPVILHPTMRRAGMGETENISFETAAKLRATGIPVALQSGYEGYVPKTRVALFEAAVAAANGLSTEEALATITIDAARILGIADRVGSLQPGRDADVAVFDGDPFEYTAHCTAVVIDGRIVADEPR